MSPRLTAPWVVLVVVAAFAYSVGAQQIAIAPIRDVVTVKAVPDGKDIRSFFANIGPPGGSTPSSVDLFTVPAGRVFVVTDVVGEDVGNTGTIAFKAALRENGPTGPIRITFKAATLTWGAPAFGAIGLNSGIPYTAGTTITLTHEAGGLPLLLAVTISGYLADAF